MRLLHRLLAPLLALCFALAPADAASLGQKAAILNGIQGWSFQGSSADLYFSRNAGSCAIQRIAKPCSSLLTTTRASTGYAQWSDGHLSSFAANIPRITDLGLLVEQAATNLALNSNDLTQATSWTLNNTTASSNQVTGPDGATSGGSLADNSTNGGHNAFASFTAVSGTTYTSSIYLKAGTATVAQLTFASGQFSGAGYANCNLSNGTVSSTGGTLVASGIVAAANGFYRCWIAATATASAVANASVILTNNNASATRSPSYAGSGQALNTFGDQIEASAFPTSYIPTTTVSVTRAADVISLTGAASAAALAAKAAYVQSNLVAGGTLPRLLHYSGGAFMDYASSTTTLISNGTNTATATMGSGSYTGLVHNSYGMGTASMTAISNNGSKATSANAWAANTGTVYVGSNNGSNALNGYMPRLAFGAAFSQFDGVTQ